MSKPRNQFAGTPLLIVTVAAVICAVLSFQHLRNFRLKDDGVTWVDQKGKDSRIRVVAAHIAPGSAGDKADIRVGDQLLKIKQFEIRSELDVPRALWELPLLPTQYTLRRNNIEFVKDRIFIQEAPRDSAIYYQYGAGAAYLVIGLFVYFRRTSAAKSLHFFILCLLSFIASTFHYSGKLNTFDEVLYWGNLLANLFAPASFLHFCLTFPSAPGLLPRTRRTNLLLYLPSFLILLLFVFLAEGFLKFATPLLELRWLLDRLSVAFALFLYFGGALVLSYDYSHSEDPIVRRQLKYLRNGALVGLLPFTLFYALPYVFGAVPSHVMNLSVMSMGLIPLTWAYAITRYRLMDVDIIFQQGYVYTLATLAVIGTFYGVMFVVFNTQTVPPPAFVVLIAFATFIFQPIRKWVQEQLDRWIFYRDRYDARLTLIEFARELSSETDQDDMLAKVSDRLKRTLSIQRIGFFLRDEATGQFFLHSATKKAGKSLAQTLDLTSLEHSPEETYLFFERPKHLLDIVSKQWPRTVRDTIAELDFTYYVACRSRGKTHAFFGVSRTTEGDFLSRDDVDLMVTLSNYVAIAIENSRLYSSLQQKADEYERLKEFSENIVESINVGVLAVGLDDRVESWNSQIEKLTGVTRLQALGKPLNELFSPELAQKFEEVRGRQGVQNFYKVSMQPHGNVSEEKPEPARKGYGGLELAKSERPMVRESIVNIAVAPLVTRDLSQIGRLIIFDDVTDRDDLERRLMQADKLSSIGLLAAGVAHEVNTPLAVISTYAQMLTKQVSGDEQKSRLLEKIAKQTFRASEIVNSLLNFSRTSPTEFVDLDLNRVIRETANLVEHQFQKAGVATRLVLADNLPAIRGNAGKLQQVFLNLFINARDAMMGGGTLDVRTWAEGSFVHVEVADTGQGIASELLSRIYDPFFTTKGPKKGTGLGLSITYGIVQEHNGVIKVDSTPGVGTRFQLEFPSTARPLRSVEGRREVLSA